MKAKRSDDSKKPDFVHATSFCAQRRYAKYMHEKRHLQDLDFRDWSRGMDIQRLERGLMRHMNQYFGNKYEGMNDEIGTDHLAAMRFAIDTIMHYEEQKYVLL